MSPNVNDGVWLMISTIICLTSGTSYNQPKFSPSATWNPNATTFADNSTFRSAFWNVFVSSNNTVYIPAGDRVLVWLDGNSTPEAIRYNASQPESVFTIADLDIYVDNGDSNHRVDKWDWNGTYRSSVMSVSNSCRSLFLDTNNTLYCSIYKEHTVMKKWLSNASSVPVIAAGNGNNGSGPYFLSSPKGIFVAKNFSLYVADADNDRIQLFQPGTLSGITVAGNGASQTITLNYPMDVALDADGYLFIVDSKNNRIVGSGPNGFRCLVGCSGQLGSSPDHLNYPKAFSFDSRGKMFVADSDNGRVQKFMLASNSSGISYNQPTLCPYAVWNPIAETVANDSTVGTGSWNLFVDQNNALYVSVNSSGTVSVQQKRNTSLTRIINTTFDTYAPIFVTINGDIYVSSNESDAHLVVKWINNATSSVIVMNTTGSCFALFVDLYDNIYCSMIDQHQVVKRSFNDDINVTRIVGGNGTNGSSGMMLSSPHGIFVTKSFDLYVADCGNDRVQNFSGLNQIHVSTVQMNNGITLRCPSGIALDADGNVFISDSLNNRIVSLGPNNFGCIAGCSSANSSASDALFRPASFSFDSAGNLYVADTGNNRIQKINLGTYYCVLPNNQPKLCASATWNPNAISVVNDTTITAGPFGLFISNDTVYVNARSAIHTLVWPQENNSSMSTLNSTSSMSTLNSTSSISTLSITSSMSTLNSTSSMNTHNTTFEIYAPIFVTSNGDIYVFQNESDTLQVIKWTDGGTSSTPVMQVGGICFDLFVDVHNNIYCSMIDQHQVVRRWFYDAVNVTMIVAGNDTNGSTADTLSSPRGIFVTDKLDLYVADCGNNRVQLFLDGQRNASTIVGNGSMTLDCPSGITLDDNENVFISDRLNHRIVSSGPDGVRCIVGCSSLNGSATDQLNLPASLAFDRDGNLFVVDELNSRIQYFALEDNSCTVSYNRPQLCSTAVWNASATTFANTSLVGTWPTSLFVNTNNDVYITATALNVTKIWFSNPASPKNISVAIPDPQSIFVTSNGDLYIASENATVVQVFKSKQNYTSPSTVMQITGTCFDVFVDVYSNAYCSMIDQHQVVRRLFYDDLNKTSIVGGNGTNGSSANMLSSPCGIFVTDKFDLYVADCGNNRVQLFLNGQMNASTIVGNGSMAFNCPSGIALDRSGNVFIVDQLNNRIVRWGPNGIQCIAGCSGTNGSGPSELFIQEVLLLMCLAICLLSII